ncbi:MAG: hypothetical protein VKS61_15300 [Candidatus Sericytochromatia bacterium]|nr:hypothetical protein [Candidatus Sericytochromatia bacterium]
MWPSLNLGASLAAGAGGVASWSVRALYRLVLGDAGSPSVAALAAAWGAPGRPGGGPPRPAVGFALAYAPRTSLTLRLDLGYSFPTPGAATRWAFLGGAPCFGAEAAWLVSDGLEVTLGLTGAGEVLGLRAQF